MAPKTGTYNQGPKLGYRNEASKIGYQKPGTREFCHPPGAYSRLARHSPKGRIAIRHQHNTEEDGILPASESLLPV